METIRKYGILKIPRCVYVFAFFIFKAGTSNFELRSVRTSNFYYLCFSVKIIKHFSLTSWLKLDEGLLNSTIRNICTL